LSIRVAHHVFPSFLFGLSHYGPVSAHKFPAEPDLICILEKKKKRLKKKKEILFLSFSYTLIECVSLWLCCWSPVAFVFFFSLTPLSALFSRSLSPSARLFHTTTTPTSFTHQHHLRLFLFAFSRFFLPLFSFLHLFALAFLPFLLLSLLSLGFFFFFSFFLLKFSVYHHPSSATHGLLKSVQKKKKKDQKISWLTHRSRRRQSDD
jgi:hypothetical protein